VLVPVKAFSAAKGRLGTVLDARSRAKLAASMAASVLRAAAPLPVCVACDDEEVAAFATANGAVVAWTPGLGLNGAVERGIDLLAARGASYVTVAHADLPNAVGIGTLEHFNGVTIAPDRARTGTNLLRVPTGVEFTFQFGRHSLDRHVAECAKRGLDCLVLQREDLALDVDLPGDLAELGTQNGGTP
jgi:2-phospho-L-lactate guanylyltransferase